MALPKFNDIPIYELTVPSTKQKVKYRPFLVKEQKVLLMALESQDDTQILNAIMNTIEACVQDKIDVKALATFDVEYIFVQIRTKAAGETTDIGLACSNCGEVNTVKVKLEDIVIDLPQDPPVIDLNEEYKLRLKYPRYEALLRESANATNGTVSQLYGLIEACLDTLETKEERIVFKDEAKEDVESFLDQLNTDQFDKIMEFVNDLPRLSHDVQFGCESCGTANTRTLEGISDFFQLPSPTKA